MPGVTKNAMCDSLMIGYQVILLEIGLKWKKKKKQNIVHAYKTTSSYYQETNM